ncbi:hypothetical protein BsIDN1_45520 [Bacillus safensis]|uniref:Tail sheath protein subtilisin-like domain-containing protein n=1 Tax=Bacillus safensis TaxID=561879 RepID=A0A5S9MFL5_BACIA|nr:hypothetical protein BsIDN1_45520 [Bacillus safensis]
MWLFIKRLRDDQGRKVQGVLANYSADHEGIINVTSGVVLEDGTEITPAKATAWVAGASAGANFNQSLTFVEYEGAVDTLERLIMIKWSTACHKANSCSRLMRVIAQ